MPAGNFAPRPTALTLTVPRSEQKSRRRQLQQCRRVEGLRFREATAIFALHEGRTVQKAVAQDGVIHAVRRVQRRDPLQRFQPCTAEIHRDVSQLDPAIPAFFVASREKCFFEPVGLALHAVDQDAPEFPVADAPAFEHMARRLVVAFGGIGRRKYLVALTTHRLQPSNPANRGVRGDGVLQDLRVDSHVPFLRSVVWLRSSWLKGLDILDVARRASARGPCRGSRGGNLAEYLSEDAQCALV